jgi:GTP-binding protein
LSTEIFRQTTTWIPTGKLNKAFEIIKAERVGSTKGGFPRIYYVTQIAVNPVTILMFVNRPELFEESYLRYITGRLQSLLPIGEVPVRLLARPHRKKET